MCNLSEKWIEIFVGPMASGQKLFPQICTDQGFGFCPDLSDLSDHRIQQIFASCTIHTQIFLHGRLHVEQKKILIIFWLSTTNLRQAAAMLVTAARRRMVIPPLLQPIYPTIGIIPIRPPCL